MNNLLDKDPYYEVGTVDDIVVSQSFLKFIDPKRNGSPRKFTDAYENRGQETKAMLRGKVFHLYCENKDAFAVSDAVKPPEKQGVIADAVADVYFALETQEEKDQMMMSIEIHVLRACRALGYQPKWGDDAIMKNTTAIPIYIKALDDPANRGKIILTAQMKEQIEKCIESLKKNEYAHRLLFWKDEFSDGVRFFKELDLFWTETVLTTPIKCKGKVDDLEIDDVNKTVKMNDPKTTGSSAHNFISTFKSYRLDIQFAMYKRGIIATFPETKDYRFEYRNIVVETQGLFETAVHRYSNHIIAQANEDLEELLERVAFYLTNPKGKTQSIEEVAGNGEYRYNNIEPYHSWR